MDSAFVHARSLYEFFTATESAIQRNVKNGYKRLTWRDYSLTARQDSKLYNEYMKPLHGRVMHLERDRSGHTAVKREVVNFAKDILDLWEKFSKKPGLEAFAVLLRELRSDAIKEGSNVAHRYSEYGYRSPFDF